jgi:arginine decarboxylase
MEPDVAMTPREAFFAPASALDASTAVGRVCAEVVTPYPPGIPALMPGERITRDLLAALRAVHAAGCPISAADPTLDDAARRRLNHHQLPCKPTPSLLKPTCS